MSESHWRVLGSSGTSIRAGETYFATIRLADSLDVAAFNKWLAELEGQLQHEAQRLQRPLVASERQRIFRRARGRLEKRLDEGHGTCALSRPTIGPTIRDALLAGEGKLYSIHSWVVMPNHVHGLLTIPIDQDIRAVLREFKQTCAQTLARAMGVEEPWHRDELCEAVAGPGRFAEFHEYVQKNPSRAGLVNWEWVGGEGIPPINVIERWGDLSIDR